MSRHAQRKKTKKNTHPSRVLLNSPMLSMTIGSVDCQENEIPCMSPPTTISNTTVGDCAQMTNPCQKVGISGSRSFGGATSTPTCREVSLLILPGVRGESVGAPSKGFTSSLSRFDVFFFAFDLGSRSRVIALASATLEAPWKLLAGGKKTKVRTIRATDAYRHARSIVLSSDSVLIPRNHSCTKHCPTYLLWA
jgi:hypothetical protein